MDGAKYVAGTLEQLRLNGGAKTAYFVLGAASSFLLTLGIDLGKHSSIAHAAGISGPALLESYLRFDAVRSWRRHMPPRLEETLIEQASKNTLQTFSDLAYSLRDGTRTAGPWTAAGAVAGYGLATLVKQYF